MKKARRASRRQKDSSKGKHRTSSSSSDEISNSGSFRAPVVSELIREESSSSKSAKSGRSQLVDLVVEDTEAEQVERVRARKEGGAEWNDNEAKHFVRTYNDDDEGEIIRSGFQPAKNPPPSSSDLAVCNEQGEEAESEEAQQGNDQGRSSAQYDSLDDRHVWNAKEVEADEP